MSEDYLDLPLRMKRRQVNHAVNLLINSRQSKTVSTKIVTNIEKKIKDTHSF